MNSSTTKRSRSTLQHSTQQKRDSQEQSQNLPDGVPPQISGTSQQHQTWSDTDLETLRTLYPTHGGVYSAQVLGRTVDAVKLKASRLGIRRAKQWTEEDQVKLDKKLKKRTEHFYTRHLPTPPPNSLENHGTRWSSTDEKILRKYYTTHGTEYAAAMLKRTPGATLTKAQLLCLPGFDSTRMERLYNEIEEEDRLGSDSTQPESTTPFAPTTNQLTRILNAVGRRSLSEIALESGTTKSKLIAYIKEHDILPRPATEPWTKEEDGLLRSMWKTYPLSAITERLRRSSYAIRIRTRELQLELRRPRWTEKEDNILRKHYHTMDKEQLARKLKRTSAAIQGRANHLGLTSGRVLPTLWRSEEDMILRKEHGSTPIQDLATKLGRTVVAIYARTQALGLSDRQWQEWEDAKLRELHGKKSRKEIAKLLNRSPGGIEQRSRMLNLPLIGSPKKYHWDRSNDQELKRLYDKLTTRELSEKFGVPPYHILYQLRRLKLR